MVFANTPHTVMRARPQRQATPHCIKPYEYDVGLLRHNLTWSDFWLGTQLLQRGVKHANVNRSSRDQVYRDESRIYVSIPVIAFQMICMPLVRRCTYVIETSSHARASIRLM